jgi:hypothetical protein
MQNLFQITLTPIETKPSKFNIFLNLKFSKWMWGGRGIKIFFKLQNLLGVKKIDSKKINIKTH